MKMQHGASKSENMERKYYDYANNHDGFDIYQDFDYHRDERKQTRTRRRKWEKIKIKFFV